MTNYINILYLFPLQNFISDFDATCKRDIFDDPKNVTFLNHIICQHFYRQGDLDIADELVKVSKYEIVIIYSFIIAFVTFKK